MLRLIAILAILIVSATSAAAAAPPTTDRVGDQYEITLRTETETTGPRDSSGQSSSGALLIERVVAVGADGLELQFDLPASASEEERARDWQFPARVAKPGDGPLRLLNASELEIRIDSWLMRAGLSRKHCGVWFFTWNAFKVECEPQSVLLTLAAFDLRPGPLSDGGAYRVDGGIGPVALRQDRSGPRGAVFLTEAAVDPEAVRRERAEQDVILAQVMGKPPVALDDALKARAPERIAGGITVRIETDASGRVTRQVWIRTLEITTHEGLEKSKTTRTAKRRPLPSSD